jgi:ornithine--oxo-acid transaminase
MTDEQGPIPTDITVIGKSIGFGIEALSLVISRKDLAVRPSGAVATRDLRPLTCALVQAGLDHLLAEHLLDRSAQLGQTLQAGLREIATQCPEVFREVRGLGYLQGMELTEMAAQSLPTLRRRLVEKGVWVEFMAGAGRRSHGLRYLLPTMRIAPPLIATEGDLDRILTAILAGTRAFKGEIR